MPYRPELTEEDHAILRSVLEEEPPAEPDDAAIAAALAEPVLAGIVARAMKTREGLLTEKGRERMRRTLAVLFLTEPRAMSLLAQARQGGDPSATVATAMAQEAPGNRGQGTT
jgi:hypothetical protein